MKSTFLRIFLAAMVLSAICAFAQTSNAATPSGSSAAPVAPSASGAATNAAPAITGTKVGAINIEGAIFGSNEGRRDMDALQKKFEPKQSELKNQNDELEALKKQLTNTQDKLNDDALNTLKKQIESKQKNFDRSVQDAQEEFGSQQQEIASRILGKLAPVIVKYAQENGFGMIIDTSKPWPQGPVVMAGDSFDITKQVVDAYNVQSGVAAPTASGAGGTRPAAPRTAPGTAPKTPATKPTEPPK